MASLRVDNGLTYGQGCRKHSPESSERVFYGNTISRLEDNQTQLAAESLEFSKEEERLSGADLAETLTNLSQAQTAIHAILTASGKISKLSLFDFLQ